jgi:hypothetical protein
MPSPHAFIVRLPSGTEYWYAEEIPAVGETVSHFGNRYLVLSAAPSDDDRIVITLADEETTVDSVAGSPLT